MKIYVDHDVLFSSFIFFFLLFILQIDPMHTVSAATNFTFILHHEQNDQSTSRLEILTCLSK